jgi:hypothetical protein
MTRNRFRWSLIALLVLLGQPVGASPASDRSDAPPPDKLPVNLPPVIVKGEESYAGPLLPGNKLSPEDGAGNLPFPRPPRPGLVLDAYLAPAPETASPSLDLAIERPAMPRQDIGELSAGTSGPHRYALDLLVGRTVSGEQSGLKQDGLVLGTLRGRIGGSFVQGAGDWSRWDLDVRAGAVPGSSGSLTPYRLGLLARAQDTIIREDGASSPAFSTRLGLQDEALAGLARLDLETGQARDVLTSDGFARWWEGRVSWNPEGVWQVGDHTFTLQGETGGRGSTGQGWGFVRAQAEDRWPAAPGWTVIGGLALGRVTDEWIADPRLILEYEPRPDTQLAIRAGAWREFPWWGDLVASRRWSGLGDSLRDVRIRAGSEVEGRQRLDDRWSLDGKLSYAWADGWLAWRRDAGTGLWSPVQVGTAGAGQGILRGEARATYLAWEGAPHVFSYRFRSVQPLGELWQELSLGHESHWWDDRLDLTLAGRAELVELGAFQIGAPQAGSQVSLDARLSWHLRPGWTAWFDLAAWPVQQRQLASTYFAPDTLTTLGLGLAF